MKYDIKWPIATLVFVWMLLGTFPRGADAQAHNVSSPGVAHTVVVWISVDGVRGDYIERSDTPFFDRMMREGAFSLALAPIFPSLTFPSHVAQATGTTVDQHGVPMNTFFDTSSRKSYSFPGHAYLLQAEPIWVTAERQGRRTAVHDWVLSYGAFEQGEPAYQGEYYDGGLSDQERIQQVLDTWQADTAERPLQLLMGYMSRPDSIGHQYGPDGPEVEESMRIADRQIARLVQEAKVLFNQKMRAGDQLYVIITSDHGMSAVHTAVNPYALIGMERDEDERLVVLTSGSLAQVYLLDEETNRQERIDQVMAAATAQDFVEVYRREEMPAHWGYNHPSRTGDIVLSLDTGYTFNRRVRGVKAGVDEVHSHRGMHGYDVMNNPEMNGIAIFWRYPDPLGGMDLGPTHSLQLHATVARLLGIQPAPLARPNPILW